MPPNFCCSYGKPKPPFLTTNDILAETDYSYSEIERALKMCSQARDEAQTKTTAYFYNSERSLAWQIQWLEDARKWLRENSKPAKDYSQVVPFIIFHMTRINKDGQTCHVKQQEKYIKLKPQWGHIVIYEKSERTQDKYAYLIDAQGSKAHSLTRDMFDRMKKQHGVTHEYVDRLPAHEFVEMTKKVSRLSPTQRSELQTLIARADKDDCED